MYQISIEHNLFDAKSALVGLRKGLKTQVINGTVDDGVMKGRTLSNRSIVSTSGLKSGYVQKRLSVRRASAGVAEGQVKSNANRWATILQFKLKYRRGQRGKAGARITGASPWNTTRTYQKVFLLNGKSENAVLVLRTGGKLKAVYGAAVAREHARALGDRGYGTTDIIAETCRHMQVRAAHHVAYAAQQQKARYGL